MAPVPIMPTFSISSPFSMTPASFCRKRQWGPIDEDS
jgi:hypothetical protein